MTDMQTDAGTMTVTLDGSPIEVNSATLGARLIVEAYADGHAVPSQHLSEPPVTEPYASELRLLSADRSQLVQSTLVQVAEQVGALSDQHEALAHRIQTGEVAPALGELGQLLSVWTTAKDALEMSVGLVGAGIVDEDAASGAINRLAEALEEIKRAISANDWPGLADVLACEMEELGDEWTALLTAAAARSGDARVAD